ncbi:glycosyl transferase, family 2 [Methanothrix thermoacetophila PT]|uniref:Glycosyl transferase, family 2 n=2 Tax=Methanothrix TaxID=2222 RepID=A0B7S8_METTP|nr:glycosyl transferase, family 2 [Methanothrix thermoacetophila PT]
MYKVFAIIVTYKPNVRVLIKTIYSLKDQVYKIIIVDNTEDGFNFQQILTANNYKIKIIKLWNNYGIGKAQNIGIKIAIDEGAEYIMLSDQDTEYPPNYIENMIKAIGDLSYNNSQIAAIGPSYEDLNKDGRRGYFVIFNSFFIKRIYAKEGCLPVSQLLATGMIIPVKILKSVGYMREDLFIDWVDMEWCWKARSMGYQIFGNANVVVKHVLGDKSVKVGPKYFNLRSPSRHYYMIRNGLYLALNSSYINWQMKLRLLISMFCRVLFYAILSKPHSTHLKYCLLGIYHGFIGRLGKL